MLLTKRARTLANLAHMCRVREEVPLVLNTLDTGGYRVMLVLISRGTCVDRCVDPSSPASLGPLREQHSKMFPAWLLNFDLPMFSVVVLVSVSSSM